MTSYCRVGGLSGGDGRSRLTQLANRVGHVVLLMALMPAGHVTVNTDYYNYPSQSNNDIYSYHRQETPQSHGRQEDTLFHPLVAPPSQHSFTWAPQQQQFSTMPKAIRQKQVADSRYASSYQQSGYQSGNSQSGNSMSGNSMSGNSMSGNSMSRNSMYGNSMSGNSMSGNSMSGNSMSGYQSNGYSQSSSGNSAATGKTYILLDPTNLIEFDLQISIPFTFDYSFLGLGRRKRDVDSDEEDPMAELVDDLMEVNLAKLMTVFRGLGVNESECLEEVICVIHRRAQDFYPLPDFIGKVLNLADLKPDFESHFNYINSTNALDYSRYVRAVQRGTEDKSSTCTVSDAPWCSSTIDNILNRPTFKLLQYINDFGKMNIAFNDGT